MAESKSKSYRVTAPLVIAQRPGHSNVEVYQGGLLPGDTDEAQVAHLLDGGLVEEAK